MTVPTNASAGNPLFEEHEGHLKRALGLPALVFFGLVYMVPLTVFTTYGIVTETTGGRLPVAYVVTLIAMFFTALSYARMAMAYPVAGSAYTYSQKSFGAPIGFLSGWSLLLDYLFLPMINYLVIGIYLRPPSRDSGVGVCPGGHRRRDDPQHRRHRVGGTGQRRHHRRAVDLHRDLRGDGHGPISQGSVNLMAPFTGDGTVSGFSVIAAGAAVLCLSFLGFDAVSTLSEEAKDPKRNVPQAIMIATVGFGPDLHRPGLRVAVGVPVQSVRRCRLGLARCDGGGGRAVPQHVLHRGLRRRARSVPRSPRRPRWPASCSPWVATASCRSGSSAMFHCDSARPLGHPGGVSVVSLLALVIDLGILASLISFGALVAFSVVNLSVIKHYFIDQRERSGAAMVQQPDPAADRFRPHGVAVDQPVRIGTEGRIGLAGNRFHLACRRHPRVPRPTPVLDIEE